VTVDVHAPLERAEAPTAQHQVRRLPVCDHGQIVGMLGQADLARRATHEEIGALPAQASSRSSSEDVVLVANSSVSAADESAADMGPPAT
jgi:CBS-domain-containing membrane protein